MIILYDDNREFIRQPRKAVQIMRDNFDADLFLKYHDPNEIIDELWLDHDLGIVNGIKETTIPFVHELERRAALDEAVMKISDIFIHTSNPVGADEIEAALGRFYRIRRVFAGDYLKAV